VSGSDCFNLQETDQHGDPFPLSIKSGADARHQTLFPVFGIRQALTTFSRLSYIPPAPGITAADSEAWPATINP
jgi:hypothetical protein